MTELTHAFRANIFAPERTYGLSPDALTWKDDDREGHVAYREIDQVRIYNVPASIVPAQQRCVLYCHSGQKIVLAATHYVRFGVTQDRSASFTPFVRELMARIAAANPSGRFIAGQYGLMWFFWLLILGTSGFLLLCGLILLIQGQFPIAAAAVFAIVIAFLPTAWRSVRQGRAKRFDPRAWPEDKRPG